MDGTLVDSYPALWESLNDMLRVLHFPEIDLQTLKRRVGRGLENLVRDSVGSQHLTRGIELFKASYHRTHLRGTFLLPGVTKALQELQKRKIKMAVASNKPEAFTRNILSHLRIERYFNECLGPEGPIQPKPDPSMLSTLMERMGVGADQTVYAGDMPLDAETAARAGVRVALIPSGGFSREELAEAKPDYLLSDITELIDL